MRLFKHLNHLTITAVLTPLTALGHTSSEHLMMQQSADNAMLSFHNGLLHPLQGADHLMFWFFAGLIISIMTKSARDNTADHKSTFRKPGLFTSAVKPFALMMTMLITGFTVTLMFAGESAMPLVSAAGFTAELLIIASLFFISALWLLQKRFSLKVVCFALMAFAFFHGSAHAFEAGGQVLVYFLSGFLLTTALILLSSAAAARLFAGILNFHQVQKFLALIVATAGLHFVMS